jgi:hypothetical protein
MRIDVLFDVDIATEDTVSDSSIPDARSPTDASDAAQASVIEDLEAPNVLAAQCPGFTAIEENSPNSSLVDPTFQS